MSPPKAQPAQQPLPVGNTALAAALVGATALVMFAGPMGMLLTVALAGGAAGALAAPLAPWLLLLFFGALLAFAVPMSEMPITVAGFNVYGADLVAYFLAVAVACRLWMANGAEAGGPALANPQERMIIVILLALTAYGLLMLLSGLASGHEPRDVFGDFRRLYFYPLAIALPLLLPSPRNLGKAVTYTLAAAGLIVLAIALDRQITGLTWQHAYFLASEYWTPQARLLSQFEIATLGIVLGLATAGVRVGKGPLLRLGFLALAAAAAVYLVLSGWRLALIFLALAPSAALVMTIWIRRERFLGLVAAAVVLLLLAGATFSMAALLFPEATEETIETLRQRTIEREWREDQRYYAWSQALTHFLEHPIAGTGIGHQLGFYMLTSEGLFMWHTSTTHNVYLDVLYQTGVLGFLLAAALHSVFIIYVLRASRGVSGNREGPLVGLFAGYLCILAVNSLQPLQTGAAVALSLIMGYILALVRPSGENEHARV